MVVVVVVFARRAMTWLVGFEGLIRLDCSIICWRDRSMGWVDMRRYHLLRGEKEREGG